MLDEKRRLKQLVADLSLDNPILKCVLGKSDSALWVSPAACVAATAGRARESQARASSASRGGAAPAAVVPTTTTQWAARILGAVQSPQLALVAGLHARHARQRA